jgi:hypothetical protein
MCLCEVVEGVSRSDICPGFSLLACMVQRGRCSSVAASLICIIVPLVDCCGKCKEIISSKEK